MAKNYNIFYIADCHFDDKLTFKWDIKNGCTQVFDNVEVKTEAMIENWNDRVTNRDHIYILGDVFFRAQERAIELLKRLHGAKHFIIGNHDRAWLKTIADTKKFGILSCDDYLEIKDGNKKVILSHYPIMFWNDQHRGAYHVYGHVHTSDEEKLFQHFGQELVQNGRIPEFRAMNAGAMCNDYAPVTLEELIAKYNVGKATKEDFKRKEGEQ